MQPVGCPAARGLSRFDVETPPARVAGIRQGVSHLYARAGRPRDPRPAEAPGDVPPAVPRGYRRGPAPGSPHAVLRPRRLGTRPRPILTGAIDALCAARRIQSAPA